MANEKRLIDANALKSQITRYHMSLNPRYISKVVDAEIGDVIDIIDEAPTVDAVVLPCKVGDTVYIVGDKFPAEIEEIRIEKDGIFFVYVEYDRGYELTEVWDDGEFQAADIGKTVFFSNEEAEAALAERSEGE